MWVMLAMFWSMESDIPESLKVYQDRTFPSYEQCQDTLLQNSDSIRESLSSLEISSRYSVKCINAQEHPVVMSVLGVTGT